MTFLIGARKAIIAVAASALVLAAALFLLAAPPALAALATNYVFTDDVSVPLSNGITLQILSGSKADSFTIQSTTVTVSVAAGDTLYLRYPGPNPGDLANNGGLSSCVPTNGHNVETVSGPATVTFTPSTTPVCAAPGGGGGGGSANTTILPSVRISAPNGGETVDAGTASSIFWTAGGTGVQYVRLKLSTDGGVTYPTTIADDLPNTGFYAWSVDSGYGTTHARVRLEAVGQGGGTIAYDESDADFVIRDLAAVITPAPTIETDKNIPPPLPQVQPACLGGSRIKLPSDNDPRTQADSAVYYCGKDGKRYVFTDRFVYDSWYPDFTGIVVVSPAVMASVPIGGNVTYKPGSLVKIQTDPKVYVVSKGGRLRWVSTEEIALALFGGKWWRQVHDVPDSFFFNYVIGDPITSLP